MTLFRSLFSMKPKEPDYPAVADFSAIVTDIHSHLIPGIDDGVEKITDSIEMIRAFSELGFKKLVTTPHVMSDYFKNTPEIILEGLALVKEAVQEAKLNITIEAAAEYYLDENFIRKILGDKMLTISGKYLLFEISYMN